MASGGARANAGRPKGATGKSFQTVEQIARWRARIQTNAIIQNLNKVALGQKEADSSEISAGKILLDKVLPNLQEIENTGDHSVTYVALLPVNVSNTQDWLKQHGPQLIEHQEQPNGKTTPSQGSESHAGVQKPLAPQRKQNGSSGHKP